MPDPRPLATSPGTFRFVAATAAAIASLGVVALGVQLGTNGLAGNGPGRNPGSASASPAAAVVDLAPTRPSPSIDDALLTLVTGIGPGAFTSVAVAATPAVPAPTAGAPSGGPAPVPPSPGPDDGVAPPPVDPEVLPPTPVPVPTVPPALDPVVDPVVDLLDDAASGLTTIAGAPAPTPTTTPAPTIEDMLDLFGL